MVAALKASVTPRRTMEELAEAACEGDIDTLREKSYWGMTEADLEPRVRETSHRPSRRRAAPLLFVQGER